MRRLGLISAAVIVCVGGATVSISSSAGAGGPYVVRAIFDDAAFAVQGEDVRIAGANVGSIQSLGVTPDNKAAVALEIDDSRFAPFFANARCTIRVQSLIGEKYVDCDPGDSKSPELRRILSGPGAGSYLLPVQRTSSPVDTDLVQDLYTQPVSESLAIIIDEFGTGLAARASELNEVIRRADPALAQTDRVFQILDSQKRQLARLAADSDAVLAPLARERRAISGFIVNANRTSVASAARATDIVRTIERLPTFLRRLRPLMADLGTLADQGTPLMNQLGRAASGLGHEFAELTPFASVARSALIKLGAAAQTSEPALVASVPLAKRLSKLGSAAAPTSALLNKLTASLDKTGAIEQLMGVLFYGTTATNGFDSLGHYVRDQPLDGSCTGFATVAVAGCNSNFRDSATSAAAASGSSATAGTRRSVTRSKGARQVVSQALNGAAGETPSTSSLRGLLGYLIGSGR